MAQGYTNDYSSTLSGSYTSGGTTLGVVSASGLPTSGLNFIVKVDSEYLLCTSWTGTTLTVTGAQGGSSAANHSSGAAITGCWILAQTLDGIRADQSQVGTYANLPASGMKQGDRYKCTDVQYEFVFDGSVWQAFCYGHNITVPALTTFAWVNQGSATVDATHGNVLITSDTAGGTNARVRTVAGAGVTFSVYCGFHTGGLKNNALAGFGMRESATGKFVFVGWNGFSGPDELVIYPYGSATSVGSPVFHSAAGVSVGGPLAIYKLSYDGTNITLYVSVTGVAGPFVQLYQTVVTTFFTTLPNQAIIMVDNEGNTLVHSVSILHFSQTTP